MNNNDNENGQRSQDNQPGFFHVVLSTLAAAIGVQSNRNRERDFRSGSIKTYVAAGIIFTALFVLTLVLVVRTVLERMG
ncbi:DUF2970 domain-containing protein [Microbulbifer guangxiensis]|uniref:DUF2970 domain-containing protein n=1 Tax=Microbulbifer guangxiensis TaxID=2904249 RepID=UPI001F190A9A|nr:DUF2970 domain-containing protein [Microbulbifer guangxiensis]